MRLIKIAAVLLMGPWTQVAAEIQFMPIFNADIRALYMSASQGSNTWGGYGDLLALPAVMFGPDDYLLPLFNMNLSSQERVIEEESFFLQRNTNLLSLAYKHRFNETWTWKNALDGRYVLNIETRDE